VNENSASNRTYRPHSRGKKNQKKLQKPEGKHNPSREGKRREREVGRTNPRKYTYRAEKKTERTPTNLALLWHRIPSRPFMCVPGVAKKQLQLAEKKKTCVKERERESKQEPSREDKTPKKKASKIRSPNCKTLYCEFPCTELCPLKKHTHTHTKKDFFLQPNYAKKKREKRKLKKKKKKKKRSRRRRLVEFAVSHKWR